jgi:PIN domain nuclease of toxin-antitoxin system
MDGVVRLDTHVVVWLYAGLVTHLSPEARRAIDRCELVVAPMVELELTFLHEIDRLTVSGAEILSDLAGRIGLTMSAVPWSAAVHAAADLAWTRDPFDRLIMGYALAAGTRLLTKDTHLRERLSLALW